jgi:hypothetical protein
MEALSGSARGSGSAAGGEREALSGSAERKRIGRRRREGSAERQREG